MAYLPHIYYQKTTLSSADILALNTVPKEIVPAPGAGKMILPISILAVAKNTATAYTGGGNISVGYGTVMSGDTLLGIWQQDGTYDRYAFIPASVVNGVSGTSYCQVLSMNATSNSGSVPHVAGTNGTGESIINTSLIIGTNTDNSASLVGGSDGLTDIPTWNAVTNGSFSITIGGHKLDVTGLNFSTCASMGDVANVIKVGLNATAGLVTTSSLYLPVSWDADHFVILAGNTVNNISGGTITPTSAVGSGTDISGAGDAFMDCATGHGTVTPAGCPVFASGTGTLDIHTYYAIVTL